MSGFLSQAVANLVAAEQQIKSLSGLPAAAQQIQANSSDIILPMVSQVQTMQQTCSGFVQSAIPQLNEIETLVSNKQPLPEIAAKMATVLSETGTLKATVDQVSTQINSVSSQVLGYFNQLATIESDLTSQMTTLQGQVGNAQSEEDAAKSRYYYLFGLAPLALFGAPAMLAAAATALGLSLKWQSDVNDYESQISSLNAQVNSLNAMKSACQLIGSDFQGVVTKISGVSNSVDFLSSDILAINSDLDTGTALLVISFKVKAAIVEVTTLGVDAS